MIINQPDFDLLNCPIDEFLAALKERSEAELHHLVVELGTDHGKFSRSLLVSAYAQAKFEEDRLDRKWKGTEWLVSWGKVEEG